MKRRKDYDLLRVGSMAAVVYLHTAAGTLHQLPLTPLWYFSNLIASLATAAVPLFFMLSGSLMLGAEKTADPGFVLRRRLPKIVAPGLAWSLLQIFFLWRGQGGEAALSKLLNLPNTTVLVAYWFLYALTPMYLFAPLLKRMADNLTPRHWNYLMGLWLAATVGLRTLRTFLPEPWNGLATENMTLGVSLLEGYLGYFLLGAYLERRPRRLSRRTLWAVVLADWAVIAGGTWWDMAHTGLYGLRFVNYQSVFTVVLAAALFQLARSYFQEGRGSGRVLTLLAGCSFGVYLAHPFAIKAVEILWFRLTWGAAPGIWGQVVSWALALAGSVIGVVLVQSVKPLCFLVTGQRFDAACRESNLFAIFRRNGKRGR